MNKPPDARAMTELEFAEAMRRRAWRGRPAPDPAATDLVRPDSATATTSNTANKAPAPAPDRGVLDMTDDEFNAALRRRVWR